MFKEMHQEGASLPTSKEEAVAYAEELAGGIRLWVRISTVIILLAAVLWIASIIDAIQLSVVIASAIGCPIIMTIGFSYGCLQYLTLMECYKIVKAKLSA
jgi:uncharacterized RDD family membrane protein YckC